MRSGATSLLVLSLAAILLLPAPMSTQRPSEGAVRPAKVDRMQNFEVEAGSSYRPAYIPAEWGHLVGVQKLDDLYTELYLQAENGDVYLVRLLHRGGYLYLDTSDKGGVVLVIKRQP